MKEEKEITFPFLYIEWLHKRKGSYKATRDRAYLETYEKIYKIYKQERECRYENRVNEQARKRFIQEWEYLVGHVEQEKAAAQNQDVIITILFIFFIIIILAVCFSD